MSEQTNRLALPLLSAGQAQKEITHNEALMQLDALVHPAVEAIDVATPPPSPSLGQAWVVPAQSAGAWEGQVDKLVVWTQGGWRFIPPVSGMVLWIKNRLTIAYYTGANWQVGSLPFERLEIAGKRVVGAQQNAVADPSGGTMIDSEVRSSVRAILVALRAHGLIATS